MRRVAIALLLLALVPSDALAWTPGTHILLGETVLRNAALLPDRKSTRLNSSH